MLKFHENCCFFKPIFCENEIAAVQKDANLVELEKCCQTHIFLQNFVLIQPRTSPPKICKILQKIANFPNFPIFSGGGARGSHRPREGREAARVDPSSRRGRARPRLDGPPRGVPRPRGAEEDRETLPACVTTKKLSQQN